MTDQDCVPVSQVQEQLIAYWQDLAAASGSPCPARRDINPWLLGPALADISLIETGGPEGPVFRLAGTSITALVGRPLRGVAVDGLDGPLAGLWHLGTMEAIARGEPVHGRMVAAIEGRDLAWLRLPLLDAGGERRLVLCHDCWVRPETPLLARNIFIHRASRSIAA